MGCPSDYRGLAVAFERLAVLIYEPMLHVAFIVA